MMKTNFITLLFLLLSLNSAWGQVSSATGTHNGHGWVDLGLPSGTKWATTNLGGKVPSDRGSLYAWGNTSVKKNNTWETAKYRLSGDKEENMKFTKYVTDSKYGKVDDKWELELSDDAAHVNWGKGWRMPSQKQVDELMWKCKWTWTELNGHEGYKIVGPNGNSIFLPSNLVSKHRDYKSLGYIMGSYYSRTLQRGKNMFAYGLFFDKQNGYSMLGSFSPRSGGCGIRPVFGVE